MKTTRRRLERKLHLRSQQTRIHCTKVEKLTSARETPAAANSMLKMFNSASALTSLPQFRKPAAPLSALTLGSVRSFNRSL